MLPFNPILPPPDFSKPPPLCNFSKVQTKISKRSDFNRFFKLKTQIVTIGSDIQFLRSCKRDNVFPTFINVGSTTKNWVSSKVILMAKRHWLNLELKSLYSKRSKLEFELYDLHLKVTKNLSNSEFCYFNEQISEMNEVISLKNSKKQTIQAKKLAKLQPSNNLVAPLPSLKIVHNLSSQAFSKAELDFLDLSLNYCLPPAKPPVGD